MAIKAWQAIAISLAFRVLASIVCDSFFVADEYFQSVEVAHNLVFGYGYLTWEWKEGIRSFIMPSVFSVAFKILQLLHLDSAITLKYVPRIIMAIAVSFEDLLVFRAFGQKAFFIFLSLWGSSYIGLRSLADSLESLLAILMFMFDSPVFLVVMAFWLRPTSIFTSIFFFNFRTIKLSTFMKGIISVALFAVLDAVFYRFLGLPIPLFTPLRFLEFNFFKNVAVSYGSQPFLFYFYSAIPSLLGPLLLALPFCRKSKPLIFALANIAFLSFSPHKEIRYLCSTLPFFAAALSEISPPWLNAFNFVVQMSAFVFLSQFHQIGQTKVIDFIASNPMPTLFLLPCHSNALYSRVHANVTLKILECPYSGPSPSRQFIEDPSNFIKGYPPLDQVVVYSSFVPSIGKWLEENHMAITAKFFNAYFHVDGIDNTELSVFRMERN